MRFSIRDLFWATLVVAMGLGWWLSHRALDAKRLTAASQANRLWAVMDAVRAREKYMAETGLGVHGLLPEYAHVDLTVLNEKPVEP